MLQQFLQRFERTSSGMFVPLDASENHYRHFGRREERRLLLTEDDVLYLYSQEPLEEYSTRTKAYFFLRNACYNVLPCEGGLLLFRRHKDFNRNKDAPLGRLVYVDRDDCIADAEEGVCCVLSEHVFTFLRVAEADLNFELPEKLNKMQ